jgi:Tfp pilus assembly protein PilF
VSRDGRVTGKLDEAIGLYEKARADDPKQKQVCRRIAVLFDTLGDFQRADDEYKKALELYPKDADLLNDIGYSYYSRGEWSTAEQRFRDALALKPDHAKAWVNLGLTLAQQQRRDESLGAFEKALPKDQALCNVAFVTAAHGKSAEAFALYQEALRLNPSNPLAQAATSKLAPK